MAGVTSTLTYDQSSRLVEVDDGTDSTGFVYDADGMRVKRTDPDGATAYVGGVFEWHSTDGATSHYTFAGVQVAFRDSAGLHWMFADHQTSTAVVVDPAGTVREQRYYPFGGIRDTDNPATDLGYTGQRLDESTGLMFYQSRYYDPTIGRFISPDTIVPNMASPQDLNRYSYVENNPGTLIDPDGRDACGPGSSSGDPCPQPTTFWGVRREPVIDHPLDIGRWIGSGAGADRGAFGQKGSKPGDFFGFVNFVNDVSGWLAIAGTAVVLACTAATAGGCVVVAGGLAGAFRGLEIGSGLVVTANTCSSGLGGECYVSLTNTLAPEFVRGATDGILSAGQEFLVDLGFEIIETVLESQYDEPSASEPLELTPLPASPPSSTPGPAAPAEYQPVSVGKYTIL